MSSLMERLRAQSNPNLPPRIAIYGTSKIGKTTFATQAPNCVVIPTEDGLAGLSPDVVHFPICKSLSDVYEAIDSLLTEEHDRKTVVLDSLDWLEPMLWKHVADEHNKPDIEAFGYGKGYTFATDEWITLLDKLNRLRTERGMMVIMIGHHHITKFEDPSLDSYDRYSLKLHKSGEGKVKEWADIIGFANYRTNVLQQEKGFNQKRGRAVGNGERMLYLEERPSFVAGNRFGLPAEMPLDFNTFINSFSKG